MSQSQETFNKIVKDLFTSAKNGLDFDLGEFKKGEPFEIPLLENLDGDTVIDMALNLSESKE